MPYITQTRALPYPSNVENVFRLNGVLRPSSGALITPIGSETTYSFRSNGTDDDDFLTGAQLAEQVGDDYRLRYDTGHEFWTEKYRTEYSHTRGYALNVRNGSQKWEYRGLCYPLVRGNWSQYPQVTFPTSAEKLKDGTEAIRRTRPTKPHASLAQLTGESVQRLPTMVGLTAFKEGLSARSVSKEYLNLEFGVKPVLRDIAKLCKAVKESNKILRQFDRDSGKVVRRRLTLRDETTAVVLGSTSGLPYIGADLGTGKGIGLFSSANGGQDVVDQTTRKTSFSGAYTYYVPPISNDLMGKMERWEAQANQVLGSRANASLAWELTPWSWLIDWHGYIGDFISNVSSFSEDSLVLRYGYVMHHTMVKRVRMQRSFPLIDGGVGGTCFSAHIVERKERTRATPYGFGLDLESMSPRQWAILAALGITKAPERLR